MITVEKIAIYSKWPDIDLWLRAGKPNRDVISDQDYNDIYILLQQLTLYKNNLVSPRYREQILSRLKEVAADDEAARQLLDMA